GVQTCALPIYSDALLKYFNPLSSLRKFVRESTKSGTLIHRMPPSFSVKSADKSHLEALVALENLCFETDRLTRRNFQWMLSRAKASLLVAEADGALLAYILVLF